MARGKTVDEYLDNAEHFADVLEKLRGALASTELEETIKWGAPCYTLDGKNVVGIGGFKSYAGLWFYEGAKMSDPEGVLINAQEGKTKSLRQWRFTSAKDVKVRAVKAYVKEAIELQKAGMKTPTTRGRPVVVPKELDDAMDAKTQKAFEALTPGRRREYADHVAEAKREETRLRRVQKILPMIRAGGGLHDKYRDC